MLTAIQPIDKIRAAQMIAAQVTGDREMFAVALQDAVEDERDASILNLIRTLTEDLAGIIVNVYGDESAEYVRLVLASQLAAASEA